jgi:transportin-1
MVYSEYDLMYLDVDEEDEAVPDKDTDIKPKAYSGKVHAGHETNDPQANNATGKSREAAEKALEEDDEDDEDYYDDDDEDEGGEWNVRKCSAAALDVMAVSFGGSMLEILMPHLQERLFSDEWEKKESAILALGAIAEGCIDSLTPHLPQLVTWLIDTLKHPKVSSRLMGGASKADLLGARPIHLLLDTWPILELGRLTCCRPAAALHTYHGRSSPNRSRCEQEGPGSRM